MIKNVILEVKLVKFHDCSKYFMTFVQCFMFHNLSMTIIIFQFSRSLWELWRSHTALRGSLVTNYKTRPSNQHDAIISVGIFPTFLGVNALDSRGVSQGLLFGGESGTHSNVIFKFPVFPAFSLSDCKFTLCQFT